MACEADPMARALRSHYIPPQDSPGRKSGAENAFGLLGRRVHSFGRQTRRGLTADLGDPANRRTGEPVNDRV
jgi:hypothetical protein